MLTNSLNSKTQWHLDLDHSTHSVQSDLGYTLPDKEISFFGKYL